MLKDRRTYEIMRPEEVGVPQATLVLGKHSGRHAVQRRCEQLGTTVDRHELDRDLQGGHRARRSREGRQRQRSRRHHPARPLGRRTPCRSTRHPTSPARRRRRATGTESRLAWRGVGLGVRQPASPQRRSTVADLRDPAAPRAAHVSRIRCRVPAPSPRRTIPPSRSSPGSAADRRRSRGARRCDTRAAAAARPSAPA